MAFNLPPPWDSGYALPQNVRDEGLVRRAFVTKWMPRGTYDDPQVGDGGYAVPGYVRAEGYGQGTHTTKWMPSGTAPRVPNWLNGHPQAVIGRKRPNFGGRKVQFAMSGVEESDGGYERTSLPGGSLYEDPFPEPYHSYGIAAASHILDKVATLPSAQKKSMLKAILDRIDPSLWARTAAITRRLIAKGMSAVAALRAALARAMSAGILAELHRIGSTGKYPTAKGQVGLGCCYAQEALGIISSALPGAAVRPAGAPSVIDPTVAGKAPADGTCTSDGRLIYVKNNWLVRLPKDTCPGTALPFDATYVRDVMKKGFSAGPIPVGWNQDPAMIVGTVIPQPSDSPNLVAEIGKYLQQSVYIDIDGNGTNMRTPTQLLTDMNIGPHGTTQPHQIESDSFTAWMSALGLDLNKPINTRILSVIVPIPPDSLRINTGSNNDYWLHGAPFISFTHPTQGGNWGVWLQLAHLPGQEAVIDAPYALYIYVGEISQWKDLTYNSAHALWDAIAGLVTNIIDFVGDVVSGVAGLACSVMTSQGAVQTAGKVNPIVGAGAVVAAGLCGGSQPVPVAGGTDWTKYLLIGGVGLVAIALATRKKKPKPTAGGTP